MTPESKKFAGFVFGLGCLFSLVVVLALFVSGVLALGPLSSQVSRQQPPQLDIVSIPNSSGNGSLQLPIVSYSNATTTGTFVTVNEFTLNFTSRISGSATATNGIDFFFVARDVQGYFFQALYTGGINSAKGYSIYTTGNVPAINISFVLPAGIYSLIIINPNSATTYLTITQVFIATRLI